MSSPLAPALKAIGDALRASEGPLLAAVDGRCASGKTTFAALCAQVFPDCNIFHMDDFFLPPEKRTPERLAAPGGNVDYERALAELFLPLSRGEAVSFSPFDCSAMGFAPRQSFPPARLSIVEGSYSHHPVLAPHSGLKLFLTCSPAVQLSRLSRRAPEKLTDFQTRWIPMEEHYFKAFDIEHHCDLTVDTTALTEEDAL